MMKEVENQFTPAQLENYGNIVLNGYLSVVPNTISRKAWQYKETTTAPVDLPSLTEARPTLKGWTTNYTQYYTELPPNAYGVNPGDPTMLEYRVHSFTQDTGTISSLGVLQGGIGYTPGTYTNVPTVGGSGTGATLNITVDVNGYVTAATLSAPGANYTVGDGLTAAPGTIGPGRLFAITVATVNVVTPGNEPKWAQPPRRFFQNQVSSVTPPQNVNNPQVIQYSFMYPVKDNPVPPPVGLL
jgi:hypothetical protein